LTEGRGTGFPTIYSAMEQNGSPDPTFETDDLSYVLVTLPIRVSANINGATNGVNQLKFSGLDELIAFANGATNGAGHTASAIIHDQIHNRVAELLNHSMEWIKGANYLKK